MTEPRRTLPPLRVLSEARIRPRPAWGRVVGQVLGAIIVFLVVLLVISLLVWSVVSLWRAIL